VFVCLLAGLDKNYSTDFHKIQWKDGNASRKKPLDFGSHPHLITLGL